MKKTVKKTFLGRALTYKCLPKINITYYIYIYYFFWREYKSYAFEIINIYYKMSSRAAGIFSQKYLSVANLPMTYYDITIITLCFDVLEAVSIL